jgi:hypothetical protein
MKIFLQLKHLGRSDSFQTCKSHLNFVRAFLCIQFFSSLLLSAAFSSDAEEERKVSEKCIGIYAGGGSFALCAAAFVEI